MTEKKQQKTFRYTEVFNHILLKHLERMYEDEFAEGWIITRLVRLDEDKWLIKWLNPDKL